MRVLKYPVNQQHCSSSTTTTDRAASVSHTTKTRQRPCHVLLNLSLQMQRKVFTQCRPALQRAAASRLVTVRAMATAGPSHNPTAITKKVFFDMEIGGNAAGE
jgi:hypothetical protein